MNTPLVPDHDPTGDSERLSSLRELSCAVLGASGFIGTNLRSALSGKVARLRALARSVPEGAPDEPVEWVVGDFSDARVLRAAVDGCDTVFHLVGSTTPATGNRDMAYDLERNVVSTVRLLDVCVKEGVKRVIFASSGGTVYGMPDIVPTPETAPTRPITAYGISKRAIEMYLDLHRHHFDLEYRVLRVSNPYGPHQSERNEQGVVAAFLRRALAGQPVEVWGDGGVARDFIYIEDVVEALIISALHEGPSRIFNIGSGRGLTIAELLEAISRVLERRIPMNRLAARSVDVPVSVLDTALAERELNWAPRISLTDGLRRTVDWMKASIVD